MKQDYKFKQISSFLFKIHFHIILSQISTCVGRISIFYFFAITNYTINKNSTNLKINLP